MVSHWRVRSFRLPAAWPRTSPRTRTSPRRVCNTAGSTYWARVDVDFISQPKSSRKQCVWNGFAKKNEKEKKRRKNLHCTHVSALRVYYRLSSNFHNGPLQPRLHANEQWGLYFYMSPDRRITSVCIKDRMSSTVETGWG